MEDVGWMGFHFRSELKGPLSTTDLAYPWLHHFLALLFLRL